MTDQIRNWMLAFDATCCTCRKMSTVVQDACDGRLSVVPLDRTDIAELRARALGDNPPHTPTLLRVNDDRVRAWTGAGIAVPLARTLGLRNGLRVTRALGVATRPAQEAATERSAMSRQRFLQLSAGAGVAAGLLVLGRKPAAFATPAEQEVTRWVAANKGHLPTKYDDVIARPMAYRKAILINSTPQEQSRLWLEHLTARRKNLGPLTGQQSAALHRAEAVFSRVDIFGTGRAPTPQVHAALESMAQAIEAAFGAAVATQLVATFGPDDGSMTPAASPSVGTTPADSPSCQCSTDSDYCGSGAYCAYAQLTCVDHFGCGTGYTYYCNGICSV